MSAADSAEDIQAALDAVMAPFDFNLASTPEGNPDGEWDRWRIDAGDEDRFVVRPEYDGEPRLIHQPAGSGGQARERQALRCDGGPRALLFAAAVGRGSRER